jgi:hypothetical protein
MNKITKVNPQKFNAKVLLYVFGLIGTVSGGDAKGYDARPDPKVPQAATPATTATQADYLLKACREGLVTSNDWPSAMDIISPGVSLVGELQNRSREVIRDAEIEAREAAVKLTLLVAPAHGKLIPQTPYKGIVYYQYQSEPGYVGKDKAVFLAEFNGKRYKIVYNLIVVKQIDDRNPVCPPNTTLIKLQNKPASGSSGYDLNSTSVTFAALDGGAIGLTNASGITLDTNVTLLNANTGAFLLDNYRRLTQPC